MKIHLLVIVMLVFTSLFVLIPLEKQSVSAGWYGSGYTYRVQITIDHTKVENHLVNFTMLFNYTSTGFKNHAQADGDDFVFCLNSTGAKLNHEIEKYDSSTGYLRAWVNVSGINHVSDVVVDLYYGNATTSSNQNKQKTWDRSYLMVQHLDDALYEDDSTSNTKDMIHSGTEIVTTGKIGSAEYFDAVGDYVRANATFAAMTLPTFEQWVKFSGADGGTNDGIMTIRVNDPALFRYTNESLYVYEDGVEFGATGAIVADTSWHYIVLTFDGTNGNLYCDKVKVKTKAATTSTGVTNVFYYGDNGLGTDTFTGFIDEGRVSTIARNWSWINTSYNNMNSPSTFYSVSAQNIIDAVTPYAPVYFEALSQNNTWIKLNWTHGATGVDKTVIRASIGSYPSLSVGSTIYNGTLHGYNHTGLSPNVHWFYRCYAWNSTGGGTYNSTSLRSHDTTMEIPILGINMDLHNTTGSYIQEIWVNKTTGNMTYEDAFYNELPANCKDGDYDTSASIDNANFIQYPKSNISIGDNWTVKDADGYINFTVDSAWVNLNVSSPYITLGIGYAGDDGCLWYFVFLGINNAGPLGADIITLGHSSWGSGDVFYEESIFHFNKTTGWAINFTAESQLNISTNLVNATETHNAVWNTPFWDMVFNATGTGNGTGAAYVPLNQNNRWSVFFVLGVSFGCLTGGLILNRRRKKNTG